MNKPDLTGKVAVITGASRGIGRTIAESLARAGAKLFLAARSEADLRELTENLHAIGAQASYKVTNISAPDPVEQLFEAFDSEYGMIDILINNAGVGEFGLLHELSIEQFDRVMDVNVRGTFLCCREAVSRMIKQSHGTIINISSVVGFKGYPEQSAYAASKHAVMGLTKSLAAETQPHGIRVSAILPGGVDTEMVRQSRPDLDYSELLQPEDVAQAVEYLLSLSPKAAVDQIYIRRRNSTPFP